MRRNLRTTTLAAVVLAASALSLPGSAQAAPWGWHGGCGCVGTGVAAGLIMGGALSSTTSIRALTTGTASTSAPGTGSIELKQSTTGRSTA
jgi:hypothetical protein